MTAGLAFDDERARRNALILAVAQALYGSVTTMLVITAGLVGAQLSTDPSWATLPVSTWIIATALTTFPFSLLMKRIGRRAGFILAAIAGGAGAALGAYAIYQKDFGLFVASTLMLGVYQASASYYRFAATDLASPAFRPRAISWVMTGGIAAALFGSLLVIATAGLLAPVTFAGNWVTMAAIALLSAVVLLALDIPRSAAGTLGPPSRPLSAIAGQPRYIVAATTGMLSFGIMTLVMTATPIAMIGCGFDIKDSSWVIQWHALAMFVPSFFTGNLISRFGVEAVSAVGMLLLSGAAVSGLLGIHFDNFAVGLVLLGLGWNFGFIGATTMLAACYEASERNKAQGLNDFLIFGTNALASLSAGTLLSALGWNSVNYAVFPLVVIALVMIGWLCTHRRAPLGA
jgi:MFS family permease